MHRRMCIGYYAQNTNWYSLSADPEQTKPQVGIEEKNSQNYCHLKLPNNLNTLVWPFKNNFTFQSISTTFLSVVHQNKGSSNSHIISTKARFQKKYIKKLPKKCQVNCMFSGRPSHILCILA